MPSVLLDNPPTVQPSEWNFRGAIVEYISFPAPSPGPSPAIVLVHGFGANCRHWRKNIVPLASAGYDVYAMDLIGFGMGDKPPPGTLDDAGVPVAYDFDYWTAELRAFVSEVVQRDDRDRPVFFAANSIGCMIAMQASIEDPSIARAHAFISPSLRQLNVRKRDWIQNIFAPLLMWLLSYRPLGAYFLHGLAEPKTLRTVLKQAYAVHEAVDDELVSILLHPPRTTGALEVFLAFIMYDTGPVPEDFLPLLSAPAVLLWGAEDEFEPVRFGRALGNYESVKGFVEIPGVGHCAHDEKPEVVNAEIVKFFDKCTPEPNQK